MISKCENVVINRVKFSEFEGYDPASESTDGLKLVGYIETDAGKRNISVDYGKILKKNGEIPPRGQYLKVEHVGDSTIVTRNEVCETVVGLKVDANDLEFIEIDWHQTSCHISDGYLPISFAHSSYALGQECALFLHDLPADITIYTPVLGVDSPIYSESNIGGFISILIVFTKVKHRIYGDIMMPTRAFVAENDKVFHAYAPTIVEEASPFARMLPASNANLESVAIRVSTLEGNSLEVNADLEGIKEKISAESIRLDEKIDSEIINVNSEIDKVATTAADAIEAVRDVINDEIENVKEEIGKVVADNNDDLSKILHVKKFDSILERDEWANTLDPAIKTKELSRTIVLVAQDNGTFEEFICVNPSATSLHSEDWDRLGAVDSIYAEHDKVGSVRLIANVEDVSFDSFVDDSMGDKVFPKKGLALAPIALKGLYDKHSAHNELINELKADLNAVAEDTNGKIDAANSTIDVILKELEIKDTTDETTISRIDAIDKTISDLRSDVTAQMKTDFELSKAEIDAIKDLIGTNGCECGKHDCHITDDKCTILCRIAENEADISNLNDQTLELNATIIKKQEGIDANATAIEDLRKETNDKFTTISGFIDDKIDEHNKTLASLNKHLETLDGLTTENKENIFTIATTVDRLSDKVDSSEKRLEDIINSTTDVISGELNIIKTDISAIEGDINRLDSDINGQITSITAIESGLADVRANVDSNAVANSEAHSEIITRITKLESDYTSDKTYKQLLEADTVHGTQAYTQVTVLKSVVDELNAQMKYNTENIARFGSRLTTVENLVNDCNEKAGFAINTSTDALKASKVATETAQQAINDTSTAVVSANEAKDIVNKTATEIKELINNHQDAHTIQLDYKNGSQNGIFEIEMKNFTQFDSAYYNFTILETRENGHVVYPSVVYDGTISADKADNRKITVTTGTNNIQTIITVHAYRAEMHVIEK